MPDLVATLKLSDQMSPALRKVQGTVRGVARTMVTSFRAATRQVFNLRNALVVVAAGAAVRTAAQFETSMSKIQGLVGLTAEEVADFSKQVLELGEKVGKGPRELAEALFFITSAGLRGAEAMAALEASAKGATAGLGETKDVAKAATFATNAYTESNLSAAQATAVLVATVREGQVEANELAGSLGKILPLASEMGLSFNELGGALAAMTRLGSNASESVSGLRGILVALQKPTEQGRETLEAVGLSFQQLREQLREKGLLEVLFTLRDALGDDEEAMSRVIGRSEALVAALSLLSGGGETARKIIASVAQTTAQDLNKAFNVASRTIGFSFSVIKAGAERATIAFGAWVGKVLDSGALDFMQAGFQVLSESLGILAQDQERVATTSDGLVSALKAVALVAAGAADAAELMGVAINKVVSFGSDLQAIQIQNVVAAIERELVKADDATQLYAFTLTRAMPQFNATAKALVDQAVGAEMTREQMLALRDNLLKVLQANNEYKSGIEKQSKATLDSLSNVQALQNAFARMEVRQKANAKAATDHAVALRLLNNVSKELSDVLNEGTSRTERDLAAMRREMGKLSVETQEFIIDGGSAEEMLRRFSDAVLAGTAKVNPAASAIDGFSDSVRRALVEMDRGITDADEFATALAQLPEQARGFVLAGEGVEGMNARLRESQEELLRTQERAKLVANVIGGFANAVADFVGQVLDKAFEGQIRTIKDVGQVAEDVLKGLVKSVIQELVRLAIQAAVTRAIAGAATGAVVEGGVSGPVTSIPGFQAGGIITGPGMFVAGEGGQNEAIVPLPNGTHIPVMDVGGGRGGGGPSITNNFMISTMDERGVASFFGRQDVREAVTGSTVQSMRDDPDMQNDFQGPT